MKTVPLKIGAKGGDRKPIKVPCQLAESTEDMTKLSKGNLAVMTRCFNRGYRIESQERSGAREAFKAGKPDAEIAALVNDYDPTKVAERVPGAPRTKTVKLTAAQTKLPAEQLLELLKAQGVNVQLATPAA